MADDLNLKPDQAKVLQSAMQVIEKLLGKSASHSERLFSNVDKTAGKHQAYLNQKEKVLDFAKDLTKENKAIETSMKIKKLLIGSTLTIEQAELAVAKEKAIEEARSAGVAESRIQALDKQYEKAMKIADENARLNNLQEQQEELSEKILQYEEERKAALEGINSTAGVFKDIMTDGRLAAGIFTSQLIKGYKSSKEVFEGVREQGLGITQSFKETGLAISDAFSFSGVSAKDSMEATKGLRAELGNVSDVTRDVRINASSLAKTFGISNEEAGKLTAQVSKLPGSSLEAANGTLEFAGNLATAAGVAPGDVMKEIAGNADAMATFAKQGGKNIAVAAVAAKKLGVEFGTIVSSAESLLDFESSIEKQMEASVLLGREINLDKARQLALEGDLVGATEEMLKNVGSEAEFNKLNVMQRKALADSMGVSVSQLGSMVKNQDKLSSLTQEQRDALATGETSMDEILANSSGFANKLKESTISVFSLAKGFGDMRRGLKSSVEGVKAFFGGFKQGTGLLDKVKKSVGGLLTGGGDLSEKAKEKGKDLVNKGDLPKKAQKKGKDLIDKANKMKPGKGGIAKTFKDIADGLKEFANGKVFAGALNLIPIALGFTAMLAGLPALLALSIPGLGTAFNANAQGIAKAMQALGSPVVLKAAAIASLVIALFGAAMIPLAYALSLLSPLIEAFAKVITAVFNGVATLIGSIADAFVTMFQAFADNWQILMPVGVGLAALGVGLATLGAAAFFAFPGLFLAGLGLMAMVPGLYLVNEIAQNNAMQGLSVSLTSLSASASGLGAVGGSLFGIAGGLGAMALAGFAALPIIGSLIALAAVAPALGKLADVFGGGGSSEDDKLGKIANKLDTLISVASEGGVINMDGKKVGDVLRLSVTSSGVK